MLSVRHCIVCASVREDNARASVSGLSPYRRTKHTITCADPDSFVRGGPTGGSILTSFFFFFFFDEGR